MHIHLAEAFRFHTSHPMPFAAVFARIRHRLAERRAARAEARAIVGLRLIDRRVLEEMGVDLRLLDAPPSGLAGLNRHMALLSSARMGLLDGSAGD